MNDIITERSDNVLQVQLNRPASKNAMTSAMYIALADLFNNAAKDDRVRVVLWHGAGDSFCAGNDVGDFMKNPPGPGESPQALLMKALINFDKPIVVAVQGVLKGIGVAGVPDSHTSPRICGARSGAMVARDGNCRPGSTST